MTDLNAPKNPSDLYEARGDVSLALPIMQGDVYDHVPVPGLSNKPLTVAIVMHPCSMRAGAKLHEKITVARVSGCKELSDDEWRNGYRNLMPLPQLRNNSKWYAIYFREVAAVPSAELSRRSRTAACSPDGILLLQQRYIFHLTRFAVPLQDLREASRPVFTESELLRDWVEAALGAMPGGDDDATINEADKAFHAYLDEDDRRGWLKEPRLHSQLRRDCRQEITRRYAAL